MELKPSPVEVVRLLATASYLFAADNPRCQRPLVTEVGEALVKEFGAAAFSVVPGERPVWFVHTGAYRFSSSRQIHVSQLAGGAHELTATVEGDTEDARDILREAWTKIGELESHAESAFTDQPGEFAYVTQAVVKLPVACTDLIPPLEAMMSFTRDRLGACLLEPPGAVRFQLRVPLSIAVRGLRVDRALVIEPRFTSVTEDRVYYTMSPLGSADHLDMLRLVLESARARVAPPPSA